MARTKRSAAETRELIFESASQILIRDGLSCLTLDAVAREAGLSKGGLLYHFPTKAALVEALFGFHNLKFESRLEELYAAEEDTPGAWLRAYTNASIEEIANPDTAALYASLFAAEERYVSAHRLMRQKYDKYQARVEASRLDQDTALLIRLAVDGLWFVEMHGYAPPSKERREKFVNMLIELSRRQTAVLEDFSESGGS